MPPNDTFLLLVREMRARAEEVLARAATFHDANAQETMREIAERYEKLAQQLETQSGGADKA